MKKAMLLALAAMSFAAAPAAGQSISQGMTSAQVREQFGAPATTRVAGDWTYWYYHNGCPRRCGSDDVVFFEDDRVVAAVLRTSRRRYTGPAADAALEARDDGTSGVTAPDDAPGMVRVGGVRVDGAEPAPRPERGEVIIVPAAPVDPQEGTPVPAREGRPGEAATITVGGTGVDAAPATTVAPAATPPATTVAPANADARNNEAAGLDGRTTVDRKTERVQEQQRRRPTATERARRNDRKP